MAKGCYLTFSEASQGTLFLHWSETPVAGALAFFEPRKNVPAFKYKSNGGRSELIREMSGGTGERIKRFYTGICQYVKLAKSFDAAVVFYEHGTLPAVEIALIDGAKSDYNVVRVRLQRRPRRDERARREPGIRHGRRRRAGRERRLRGVDVLAGVFHLHGHQSGQRVGDISRHKYGYTSRDCGRPGDPKGFRCTGRAAGRRSSSSSSEASATTASPSAIP